MTQSLLLPWFPVLLAVGVGGRLLGRARGFGMGLICALFWITLVQAAQGVQVWRDGWTVMTLVVGSFAILMMGGWAGQSESALSPASAKPDTARAAAGNDMSLRQLGSSIEQFHAWMESRSGDADPWPDFGEFIRGVLYQTCQATHVRPYRLLDDGQEVQLLRAGSDPLREPQRLPSRKGLLGHVLTSGRSYTAGDAQQNELVSALAQEEGSAVPWCFPVSRNQRRLGAITVGQLAIDPRQNTELLRSAEQIITTFWLHLVEATRSKMAGDDDPVSHLLNRNAFFRDAQLTLRESYDQNEPVAVAIIAVQGLRQLNDSGKWDIADEVIRSVGGYLRHKVRMDDRIGRFDGSRFVWLLRRVDSELARLIVSQVISRLAADLAEDTDERAPNPAIGVYCGLTGAGLEKPDLRTLVARALVQSHRARVEKLAIATDIDALTTGRRKAAAAEVCL